MRFCSPYFINAKKMKNNLNDNYINYPMRIYRSSLLESSKMQTIRSQIILFITVTGIFFILYDATNFKKIHIDDECLLHNDKTKCTFFFSPYTMIKDSDHRLC